ncbi:hypothetical protein L227DRAFT_62223 [Lentinus tigrinus ALCF2SS1-6]|uniref:Uncharacterized protein n=1 Tax=Lentinus tigrinus ALCF2SS1-6 TaxID=1328759 RepID=A0A5C2RMB1_9APHY|nr:hypothetical protein L227DRAFT_62223 [Lentinus tigrinus ALCF2SS1-6]
MRPVPAANGATLGPHLPERTIFDRHHPRHANAPPPSRPRSPPGSPIPSSSSASSNARVTLLPDAHASRQKRPQKRQDRAELAIENWLLASSVRGVAESRNRDSGAGCVFPFYAFENARKTRTQLPRGREYNTHPKKICSSLLQLAPRLPSSSCCLFLFRACACVRRKYDRKSQSDSREVHTAHCTPHKAAYVRYRKYQTIRGKRLAACDSRLASHEAG